MCIRSFACRQLYSLSQAYRGTGESRLSEHPVIRAPIYRTLAKIHGSARCRRVPMRRRRMGLVAHDKTRTHPITALHGETVWTFEEAREYARSFGFGSKDEYIEYRCPGAYALPRDPVAAFGDRWTSWADYLGLVEVVTRPGFEQVLFVEMGWGADQHGQNATKACVRAARNAIESNTVWKSTSELGYPENCGESPP